MIRVVIVDDEAPARERLRHLLHADGADVEIVGEAADGDEAIACVDSLAPDLVFLDIQMPARTGLDVVARLRAPKPRIVFCTAYDEFAIDAFELHAVDYLLKPVNRDRLSRTLARLSGQIADERRHVHERREAVRTQARLMPASAPPTVGIESAGCCRPADGVSGDFYDLLAPGDGRLAVVVGDVSGKGTYAGLLAAALQARLQTITAQGSGNPAAVLSELNRLTVGTMDENRFATLFFGVFDPGTRTLTYANAGHPAGLIVSRDGRVRRLEATGPAIGWIGSAPVEQIAVPVGAGDVVAICSDGITEAATPDGTDLGSDGLADIVRRHAHLDPASMVAATMADVAQFAQYAPAPDDRTLVVAKVM